MMMETGSPNVRLATRRTTGDSRTSPSLSTTEQSDSPVSSNSSTMEGSLGYTVEPRVRRMRVLLSYMPLPTTHLTNPSNHFLPGSATVYGETAPAMPSSRTPSTTSMTGDSSLTSTDIDNLTRITHTWSRRSSFSRPNERASSRIGLLSRTASSMPDSAKKSNTSLFARLRAPFNQLGKRGAPSSHPDSSPPKDKDVFM